MMHSGPGEGYGYETIVKVYNQDNESWEEQKGKESQTDFAGLSLLLDEQGQGIVSEFHLSYMSL